MSNSKELCDTYSCDGLLCSSCAKIQYKKYQETIETAKKMVWVIEAYEELIENYKLLLSHSFMPEVDDVDLVAKNKIEEIEKELSCTAYELGFNRF